MHTFASVLTVMRTLAQTFKLYDNIMYDGKIKTACIVFLLSWCIAQKIVWTWCVAMNRPCVSECVCMCVGVGVGVCVLPLCEWMCVLVYVCLCIVSVCFHVCATVCSVIVCMRNAKKSLFSYHFSSSSWEECWLCSLGTTESSHLRQCASLDHHTVQDQSGGLPALWSHCSCWPHWFSKGRS